LSGKYLYEILQQMKNNPVMSCFRSKNNQMCAVEKANKGWTNNWTLFVSTLAKSSIQRQIHMMETPRRRITFTSSLNEKCLSSLCQPPFEMGRTTDDLCISLVNALCIISTIFKENKHDQHIISYLCCSSGEPDFHQIQHYTGRNIQ
jgi:hypothetical protein